MNVRINQLIYVLALSTLCSTMGCSHHDDFVKPTSEALNQVDVDDDKPVTGAEPRLFGENTSNISIRDEGGLCFAKPSWVYHTFKKGDDVSWKSKSGKAYTVSFLGSSPLDRTKIVSIPKDGTVVKTMLSDDAVTKCTAAAATNCYFSYTIAETPNKPDKPCTSLDPNHPYTPGLHIKP